MTFAESCKKRTMSSPGSESRIDSAMRTLLGGRDIGTLAPEDARDAEHLASDLRFLPSFELRTLGHWLFGDGKAPRESTIAKAARAIARAVQDWTSEDE